MKDFLIQFIFMMLGVAIPILARAVNYARDRFSLQFWIGDNRYRFLIAFVICLIVNILLHTEGDQIIEAMKSFGFIVPVLSSSVIGFAVSAFVLIKASSTNKSN